MSIRLAFAPVFFSLLLANPMLSTAADKTLSNPDPVSSANAGALPDYGIQPGDVLTISVWKEEGLQNDVLVRPDGRISFPLVGDIPAAGKSIAQLTTLLTERLTKYIPDPVVTVSVKSLTGNTVYVIGKVNKPGEFTVTHYVDVMQALSMAGGTNAFAAVNDIKVLRRENGSQRAINFRYGDVEAGKRLDQNIILHGGDIVVVP